MVFMFTYDNLSIYLIFKLDASYPEVSVVLLNYYKYNHVAEIHLLSYPEEIGHALFSMSIAQVVHNYFYWIAPLHAA